MAISATTGGSGNSASAASLALGSFALTAGQGVIVFVALGSTASSVTSITDTKGNTYTFIAAVNGTGIRLEAWKSLSVAVQAGNIITINVSPSTTLAGAAEEYAGISALGNNNSNSGVNDYMRVNQDTQDSSNFVVTGFGFAAQSGDTLTTLEGTSRRTSIPAATRPGIALYDNTSLVKGTLPTQARISTARNWVAISVELRSGAAATVATTIAPTTAPAQFGPINQPKLYGQMFPRRK